MISNSRMLGCRDIALNELDVTNPVKLWLLKYYKKGRNLTKVFRGGSKISKTWGRGVEGINPEFQAKTHYLIIFLAKTAWKWKKNWTERGHASLTIPGFVSSNVQPKFIVVPDLCHWAKFPVELFSLDTSFHLQIVNVNILISKINPKFPINIYARLVYTYTFY